MKKILGVVLALTIAFASARHALVPGKKSQQAIV